MIIHCITSSFSLLLKNIFSINLSNISYKKGKQMREGFKGDHLAFHQINRLSLIQNLGRIIRDHLLQCDLQKVAFLIMTNDFSILLFIFNF